MAPLPENAKDIPEVVITKDMMVKAILDVARGEFAKNPWKGHLWATDLQLLGKLGQDPIILVFNMVDKDGKYARATDAKEVPVEFLAFIGSQEGLRLQNMDRAFSPLMLPKLEEKWRVFLDDILWMPSVIHLLGRDLYVLEFTDGDNPFGTNGTKNKYSSIQDSVGPNRTLTQTINFARAGGETEDSYNSNLSYYLGAEPWQFRV
jgi:hypothetical protein